jgi:hypothetical protein
LSAHTVAPRAESWQDFKEDIMVDTTTIEEFKASLRGELIQPNDEGYELR